MNKEIPLNIQIEHNFAMRRIKLLGIAITIGLFVIFILGIFIPESTYEPEYFFLNIVSLIICIVLCAGSLFFRKMMLRTKVKQAGFLNSYFNANIFSFMFVDFGGLFAITTNLFINRDLVFASVGFLISAAFMVINFPSVKDFDEITL